MANVDLDHGRADFLSGADHGAGIGVQEGAVRQSLVIHGNPFKQPTSAVGSFVNMGGFMTSEIVVPQKSMLAKLSDVAANLPARWAIFIALYLVATVAMADYLTGYRFGFSRFYLLPILLITWSQGRTAGVVCAVLVSVGWTGVDAARNHDLSFIFSSFWNSAVRLGYFVVTVYLLAGLREALQVEKRLARMDFLTGVANRRFFFEAARAEIDRARRYQHPFIVAYIDIDGFKGINDRLGHAAGDALLRLVAQTARANLRTVDVIARLGGDEFAILLPETGGAAAADVMRKIHANLIDAVKKQGWPVTFSIGTVTYAQPPVSVDEMVRRADNLMYAVKNAGKNTIRYETLGVPTA